MFTKRLRPLLLAAPAVAALALFCTPPARAQDSDRFQRTEQFYLSQPTPQIHMTLSDLFNKGLWSTARDVFTPNRSGTTATTKPKSDAPISVELFTPGIVGAAIRYHW